MDILMSVGWKFMEMERVWDQFDAWLAWHLSLSRPLLPAPC